MARPQTPIPKRIVQVFQVYDIIKEHHASSGCLKAQTTYNKVKIYYANITKAECEAFCDTCPDCGTDIIRKKKHKGAAKAILSSQFRDRFQADLVDYRENPIVDVYGRKMKWLLCLKDHATRLCYLVPLPSKEAKFVAHELNHIFGLLGYPLIYHSDNGNEVSAHTKEVMAFLKSWDPEITTIAGRPRVPVIKVQLSG